VNKVIPPGMDFSYVTVQDTEGDGDLKSLIGSDRAQNKRNLPPIWSEVTNSSYTYLSLSEKSEVKDFTSHLGNEKYLELFAIDNV
jgi:hypothetical protein